MTRWMNKQMMTKFLLFICLVGAGATTLAQNKEAEEINFYIVNDGRTMNSKSPFGYEKLEKMKAAMKLMSQAAFDSLSPEEKFTFAMSFPEQFQQICAFRPPQELKGKIYLNLAYVFTGSVMSKRQKEFLLNNPRQTIDLIRQTTTDTSFIGYNYKLTIRDLNAFELVPLVIANYRKTHDNDLLSLLIEMMLKNRYAPFLRSEIGKEFKTEMDFRYNKRFLAFTKERERIILKYATELSDPFRLIPAGEYQVGQKGHRINPLRTVKVDSFRIALHETTNREFEQFVRATHYVTDAERNQNALVFEPGLEEFRWMNDTTACWRYPNGISRGGIENKMNHPVTCISYSDILAYCEWAKLRLPTLDEWEIAARAGSGNLYFFGDNNKEIGKYANIWHKKDHLTADSSDHFMYTSPVGSFEPNAWGLYDIYGNVFEFCSGKLSPDEKSFLAHARGGSWWCSKYACNFFNSVDIGRTNIHASFSNQGFRVVKP